MREEENLGTLDFGRRGRIAGAEVLQMRLLLRCELDGILG
jgi:hypothetical protein